MEKWLKAFASGLHIDVNTEEGVTTKPATDEQIEAFEKALNEEMNTFGSCRYLNDVISFDYGLGKIRGSSKARSATHTKSGNVSMHNVMQRLPKLSKGECYTLPIPTYISFRIVDKSGDKAEFDIIRICEWILQAGK